ncbi:stage III sporulation protein SpoIIIAB [Alkaliphilus crotonatoxidans]
MTTKIIFSCIIIICSGMVGQILANGLRERTRLLGQLIHTLQMLETEIVYGATPLPILLKKVAAKSKKEISILFDTTAEILLKKDGFTFPEAWAKGLQIAKNSSELKGEDIELLINLGNNLGTSDKENQVKYIRLTMEGLRKNYEEAVLLQNKNVSLYKHLGFLAGLTIVIILF